MADTLAMQRAVRRLAIARQRIAIGRERGNSVTVTCAIGDEQESLREISHLRQIEAERGEQHEVERPLRFSDLGDDDDEAILAHYRQ